MDIRLVVEKGNTRIRTLGLRAVQTIVGRQQGCGLRIPSGEVSRRHCVLCIQDGYLTVEDLGSANGTFVNGQRTRGRSVVRPGDHLEIGPVRFVVEYELTPAAVARLRQWSPSTGSSTQLENLPVAEEVSDWAAVTEPVDVLPVTDKKTAPIPVEPIDDVPHPAARNEEALPLAGEFDDEKWQLPESDELRHILAQLDESKHPKSRRP